MAARGSFDQQLVLQQLVLLPGGEWVPTLSGWGLIRVTRGMGYWMQGRRNEDLASGSVLILSELAQGLIRSSQLCETVLHYFSVQTEKLSSVLTLAEQKIVHEAGRAEPGGARLVRADHQLADKFERLCEAQHNFTARSRLQMLELLLLAFERDLSAKNPEPVSNRGARVRLEVLLKQMHPADILEQSFVDLAAKVGCSPRHLGRLFQQCIGVSFREKRAQVRLGKAQQLLAGTKSKVVEVALESGYQSLSLFNLMFKRRFGVTPTQWRHLRIKRDDTSPSAQRLVRPPAIGRTPC